MRRNDTIDKGPSKLLLKQIDLDNYFSHRRRLTDMSPMTKPPRNGEHIKRINLCNKEKILTDRNEQIERDNRFLFEKIRGIMERPAYVKATLYDSKAMAAIALNSSPSSGVDHNQMSQHMNDTMDLGGSPGKTMSKMTSN